MSKILISVDDFVVQLNDEEFEFIKKTIEQTLKFWADAKKETEEFPWELFDNVPFEINPTAIEALKLLGIDTFGL